MSKVTMWIVAWLWNQMFQYALGKKISLTQGKDLYLDTDPLFYDSRDYELWIFNIEERFATSNERPRYQRLWKKKIIDKARYPFRRVLKKLDKWYIIENPKHPKVWRGMFDFHPKILKPRNTDMYLEWFWQSEKYFMDIENIIRKEFTLKEPLSDTQNITALEQIASTNSVSLHIRRTDYIGSYFAWIATPEYYDKAIKYIIDHVENPTFFIFSDDISRCKDNVVTWYPTYYIDRNTKMNSYRDLILMSKCKHNIMANSSFSRWWAWLNDNPLKIVIAPSKHHQNLDYKDIIPERWIRL